MATVKISELAPITVINANTANTLLMGVDIPTGITGKFTAHTLAQGLYSNEVLNVGTNPVTLPNTIAQFTLDGQSYIQTNLLNNNDGGSADYVVTANSGSDTSYFIDMGYANKDFIPGSEYNSLGTSINRLDGYIYTQGSTSNTWGGNLIVGSTTTGKEIRFIAGGGSSENVSAKINATSIVLNRSLVFADGTSQNTAAGLTAGSYANAAFIQANAVYAQSNTGLGVNLTQNTSIASAFIQANSAYTKANNALANTSGTFAGDLNITGTLKASGVITLNNSSFAINTAFLSIVASDDFSTVPPSNTNYMIHVTGKANSVTRVVLDSFGQNTYPLFAGRMGRGSAATPTAVANNDIMMRVVGNGYTGTTFPGSSPTKIDFLASENFSDTNRGTRIEFWNTPIGSNTIQKIASFNANSVEFTGTVNPQKGFIYTPRIPVGNQTTITIDYTADTIIKANLVADLTVSHSNFVTGKVVEVWLTNSGGTQRTVTHGVSAINSTTNSTTFSIPATSSAYMRYFSIDGDLANTYVTVTHA